MRLQAKYNSIIITLVLLTVVLLSSILISQFRASTQRLTQTSEQALSDYLRAEVTKRGAIAIYILAETLVNPLYRYDIESMDGLINAGLAQEDIISIEIYNAEGALVHNGRRQDRFRGLPLQDPQQLAAISQKGQLYSKLETNQITLLHPIWIGETALGAVRMSYSLNQVNRDISQMQKDLHSISQDGLRQLIVATLIVVSVITMMSILINLLTFKSFIDPIKKLAQFAAQVGVGNYDHLLKIERQDELGDLANAFNQMTKNLKTTTNEVMHMAYHDPLTGLSNRLMLCEYLSLIIKNAKRNKLQGAVLFIDLDEFKRVNDTLGHDTGDQLLIGIATRLQEVTRGYDFISVPFDNKTKSNIALSRLGGDEFTLVLPNINQSSDVAVLARRIVAALATPFNLSSHEVVISASIGITIFPDDGDNVETLLKNADMAMYAAKDMGRNNYQYFTEEMNAGVHENLMMEAELRFALANNQLSVYYQPQLAIGSRKLVAAEALIRWKHPHKGYVPPDKFIQLAERTGLIEVIGEWVLRTACKQAKQWSIDYASPCSVSVNVSSVQFRRQDIAALVSQVLAETQLPAHLLHIEITETSLIHSEEKAALALHKLRQLGVTIWIDDFGTGYSSLSHLREFPLDGVKIDRSFINDINHDPNDLALTQAIIAMAQKLDLKVVAEGVENQQQLKLLTEKSCDFVQGYYIGHAVNAREFSKLLEHADTSYALLFELNEAFAMEKNN